MTFGYSKWVESTPAPGNWFWKEVPRNFKLKLAARAGFKCEVCGKTASDVYPKSKAVSGDYKVSNYKLLCSKCAVSTYGRLKTLKENREYKLVVF